MKRVDIISKVVGRSDTGKPVGGGISIPMGNYALKSDFESLKSMFNDFLEGDDTDSVINRWKDLEAFLNGISEDSTLDSILKAYVTLSGTQTITGEKNFVGGLKVNGSPIYYDKDKKYWKLEGDLLVTGGVSMYSNDTAFTPSTIMDAISVDGTTISKEGAVLKVIGAVGGATTLGSLTNVGSWADSVASQDRIMYQAANSSQWIAKNLSDLAVGGVTGDYLPLSGGILTGDVIFVSNSESGSKNSIFPSHYYHRFWASNDVYVHFYEDSIMAGTLNSVANLRVASTEGLGFKTLKFSGDGALTWDYKTIWHAGNDGSGSGLDADLLDGKQPSELNVASATKLQTPRTIWGQSFDGTGNVDGWIVINASTSYPIRIIQSVNSAWVSAFLATNSSLTAGQHYNIDFGHSASAYNAAWVGYYHAGVGSTSNRLSMGLNSVDDVINILGTGNVGIGTTSPDAKLHIVGDVNIAKPSTLNQASLSFVNTSSDLWQISGRFNKNNSAENDRLNFYYYNGTTWSTIMTLYNNGNMLVSGGITMYSDQRKKTILNHVELSLQQVANAPLIEHYYNSDKNKTTHVGSIAQYWAEMNDWFCKKDNEGFYTMEIQNAALASAISVARELVKFETETDRRIRLLEEENKRLKEEIERLKWNIA